MRRRSSSSNFRIYALITAVCGVLAVLAHFLFEASDMVRQYAEETVDNAVQDAVKKEVQRAATARRHSVASDTSSFAAQAVEVLLPFDGDQVALVGVTLLAARYDVGSR